MKITNLNHIHFTGIKGVGMTALALCALDLGIKVTGSDVGEVFVTDETLKKRGIKWSSGFSRDNLIPKPDLVVTTGAHGGLENPEVIAAKSLEIPVLTHAQALGEFMKGKIGISVCGVGGKTTTSSMIAHILDRLGESPSYAVGAANIFSLGAPGRFDKKGKYFVAEADEYVNSPGDHTPRFSFQHPEVIVVTNIEHDHPDVYPTFKDTQKAFNDFFNNLPKGGTLVANYDNEHLASVLETFKGSKQTYGKDAAADWIITGILISEGKSEFSLLHANERTESITLSVPGVYNIYNAAAAIAAVSALGLGVQKAVKHLSDFTGTKRRFENMGGRDGVVFYDDYAHHPLEIKSVLEAARSSFGNKRIVAIFQPHTYSRTKQFLNEFAFSFENADIVGIMDIYASARERNTLGMSGKLLAQEISKRHKHAFYIGGLNSAKSWMDETLKAGDVVMTMGAGNLYLLHSKY